MNDATLPCKYCGCLTANWFAQCCDEKKCRDLLAIEREADNKEFGRHKKRRSDEGKK